MAIVSQQVAAVAAASNNASQAGAAPASVTTVAVTITEEKTLVVNTGSFDLTNATVVATFLAATRQAACEGIVGTCSTTLVTTGRRLSTGNASSTATVALTRQFDFASSANATKPVEQMIATSLASQGVGVTSSTTTRLDATSTVTTVGDIATGRSSVTNALSDANLNTALAQALPSVTITVSQPTTLAPPALPPLSPPPISPPPNFTIAGPAFSVMGDGTPTVMVTMIVAAVFSIVLVAAISKFLLRRARKQRAARETKVLPYPLQPSRARDTVTSAGVTPAKYVENKDGFKAGPAMTRSRVEEPQPEAADLILSPMTPVGSRDDLFRQMPTPTRLSMQRREQPIANHLTVVWPEGQESSESVLAAIMAQAAGEEGEDDAPVLQFGGQDALGKLPASASRIPNERIPSRLPSRRGAPTTASRCASRGNAASSSGSSSILAAAQSYAEEANSGTPKFAEKLKSQAEERFREFQRSRRVLPPIAAGSAAPKDNEDNLM